MEEQETMKAKLATVICILACLAIAIPVAAQRGAAADPISGSWSGDWGPSPADRNSVTVDLKLEGKTVTGTVKSVQPPRPDVALTKSTFDAGKVHLEANATNPRGGAAVHYIIDGTLANGVMTGSWNHDSSMGDFKLTKKP
jgi:hypothetical protein